MTEKLILELYPKLFSKRECSPIRLYVCFQELLKDELTRYCPEFDPQNPQWQRYSDGGFQDTLLFKCAKLAAQKFFGSLMCNYYAIEFASYNNQQNTIGYDVYDPLEYGDDINLTSPISTYSEAIEYLDKRAFELLDYSNAGQIEWTDDFENARSNLLSLLTPILYADHEWILISISIHIRRYKDDGHHALDWGDTCLLWMAADCNETITESGDNRKLTIESLDYKGNVFDYIFEKGCFCVSMDPFELYDAQHGHLVFPPALLIRHFNLKYTAFDSTWRNADGEIIIYCNNNIRDYYTENVTGTTYIRKDALDKFADLHNVKYFSFTERFPLGNKCDVHYEIENGDIIRWVSNYSETVESKGSSLCEKCPFRIKQKIDKAHKKAMLRFPGIIDDIKKQIGIVEETTATS